MQKQRSSRDTTPSSSSPSSSSSSAMSSMLSNTMSLFGASPPPSAQKEQPVENSPYDIPKDDLMHLCMKMNKRMQFMEEKQKELLKAKKACKSHLV